SLTHKVHWQYSSVATFTVDSVKRNFEVLVYAHWRFMLLYCRSCHSPSHAAVDCPVKLRIAICYLCNEIEYMSNGRPRKNSYVNSTASNKKACKSPVATQVFLYDSQTKKPVVRSASTQPSPAAHPTPVNSKLDLPQSTSDVSAVSTAAATGPSPASIRSSARYPPHQTRPQITAALISSEDTPVVSEKACSACNQTGHPSKRSNQCHLNARNKIPVFSSEAVESESMELDNDDASHHQDAPSNVDPAS
ncbi:hypothetical protein BCV72DRAFT_188205, partial [Rhizopus microsporus var. microsporus]